MTHHTFSKQIGVLVGSEDVGGASSSLSTYYRCESIRSIRVNESTYTVDEVPEATRHQAQSALTSASTDRINALLGPVIANHFGA